MSNIAHRQIMQVSDFIHSVIITEARDMQRKVIWILLFFSHFTSAYYAADKKKKKKKEDRLVLPN